MAHLLQVGSNNFKDFVEVQKDGSFRILFTSTEQLEIAFSKLVESAMRSRDGIYSPQFGFYIDFLTDNEDSAMLKKLIKLTPTHKPHFPQIDVNWGGLLCDSFAFILTDILHDVLHHPSAKLPSIEQIFPIGMYQQIVAFTFDKAVAFVTKLGGVWPASCTQQVWDENTQQRAQILQEALEGGQADKGNNELSE